MSVSVTPNLSFPAFLALPLTTQPMIKSPDSSLNMVQEANLTS